MSDVAPFGAPLSFDPGGYMNAPVKVLTASFATLAYADVDEAFPL